MDYLVAIIYGTVQGITEFLPISSSGHLVVLHEFLPLPVRNELAFDATLHAATLLAVIFYFRQYIGELLIAWFNSLRGKKDELSRISWLIILGTIPAAISGWLFEEELSRFFQNNLTVAIMLVIVGLLFLLAERMSRQVFAISGLNWKKTIIIGISQALALVPGTSRSGVTVIAGLFCGLKREAAVRFSFLLSVPIIAGASLKGFIDLFSDPSINGEVGYLAVSFIFAAVSGFIAIKYFIQFTKNHKLDIFAYYRFALAAILFIFLFLD